MKLKFGILKLIENLKMETGWLNLAGLFWLKEGDNIFGSSRNNDVVFTGGKCPLVMGKFTLKDSIVTMVINNGINVICDNKKVFEKILTDEHGNSSILEFGSLRWFVIKRGPKFVIKLLDLEADLVNNFEGIERFPINSDWKIQATFQKYNPPPKKFVPNILGMIDKEKSPGALIFSKNGSEFKIDVLDGGESYFVIFTNETSGNETYGGGRFISVSKPDSTGNIFIDFNKSYNPPCVFTKFAACPLPPKQNYLKVKVLAGEKRCGHGNH